ncbi:putative chromatin regulatory protein sir2 [Fasciola hepatica]|uniref:Regulatory protein SIR2 homolog 7 n=1 Tax=Fasciola hepatica TaxID=6192 RepID=A0A4E0R4Z3_FASHE|nr:putative chromatin regulatory protein sir2 [Fasciola hepatica]
MDESDWRNNAVSLGDLIQTHKGRIVIYTGAGISTSANIPDYRGTNGLWVRNKKPRLSDQDDIFQSNTLQPEKPTCETPNLSDQAFETPPKVLSTTSHSKNASVKLRLPEATLAKPTFTHMAIKALVAHGFVRHVISQNVDGLHMRSGLPREKLSELHGNLFLEQCVSCGCIVKRRFDVAENTSRGHHLTGRICPDCRLHKPAECYMVNLNLCSAVEKVINGKGHLKSPRKAFMLAQKSAALKLLRSRQKIDSDANQSDGGGPADNAPLLRDVVVHFYERQPEMGLAEIYRVAAAIQAVHGRKPLQDSIQFCLAQESPEAYADLGADAFSARNLALIHSPWFKRMLPAFRNNPIVPINNGPESPAADCESSATLIIVLGSSLQVLRNYAFLWPQGLGKCFSESKTRRSLTKRNKQTNENPAEQNDGVCLPPDSSHTPSCSPSKTDRCSLAIVNLQPTCKDGLADIVIHATCDAVLQIVMSECLGLPVPDYDPLHDDPLYTEAILLNPDEEHTRTRPDIPFECFVSVDRSS